MNIFSLNIEHGFNAKIFISPLDIIFKTELEKQNKN
jgi:hypothetical protein